MTTSVPDKLIQYKIYDQEEHDYWQTRNGKGIWAKPSHAKNAYNANPPLWVMKQFPYGSYRFDDQERMIIHKIVYVLDVDACCIVE